MTIRCVVVTPERTELDRVVTSVVLPMYDGELGVQRGRAPLIGRLGYGELRLTTAAGTEAYFIDGGFVQVENDIVSVLTARALPSQSIPVAAAREELAAALAQPSQSREQQTLKAAAVMRARGKLRTAVRQQ